MLEQKNQYYENVGAIANTSLLGLGALMWTYEFYESSDTFSFKNEVDFEVIDLTAIAAIVTSTLFAGSVINTYHQLYGDAPGTLDHHAGKSAIETIASGTISLLQLYGLYTAFNQEEISYTKVAGWAASAISASYAFSQCATETYHNFHDDYHIS